jgi:hypothetical protein
MHYRRSRQQDRCDNRQADARAPGRLLRFHRRNLRSRTALAIYLQPVLFHLMLRRLVDTAVLATFAALFRLAVLLLRHRKTA